MKTTLPPRSGLHKFVSPGDFLDCYAVQSSLGLRQAANELMSFPWWVRGLMSMRNILVAPFGLTTETDDSVDKVGLFPIESETEDEIVAGFNDKHLNFRLGIGRDGDQIYLATWVHPHNFGGRLYLGLVMPFHVIIIRSSLKRIRDR